MADVLISEIAYCKMVLHAVKYPHCAVNGIVLAEKSKATRDAKCLTLVDCVPLFHLGNGLTPMVEVALTQIDYYCKDKGLVLAGCYQANVNLKDNAGHGPTRDLEVNPRSIKQLKFSGMLFESVRSYHHHIMDVLPHSAVVCSYCQTACLDLVRCSVEAHPSLVGPRLLTINLLRNRPDYFTGRIADKIHENFNDAVLLMIDNKKLSLECEEPAVAVHTHSDGKWRHKEQSSVLERERKALATLAALLQTKSHRTLVDFDNHLDNVALSWQNISLNEEISRLL